MTDSVPGDIQSGVARADSEMPRRRGRPALDADYQRDRIMAAATEIFIERGFSASSVDAIGAAAGVTKRTIYDLIGSKDALFKAVCGRLCAGAAAFHFTASVTQMPLRDMLLDMATTILDSVLSPRATAFNRMLAVEALRFPDLVVSVMDVGRNEMHAAIAGVFADLAARKLIPPVDPSLAANAFFDAVVGSRAMRAMLGYEEPYPPRSEIEARVDMVLRGFIEVGADIGGQRV